ncbi:hypothetical protein E3N88_23151 [Mikania micrantha]|uniref:Uncharacterized protein n=1 Tax=Mikania micrantha TaxID=192012 RepID=A0A5N6NE84_9ASTR|nr:hypothetical protein E3N88_23151 [Mikania micrantha]
MSSLFSDDGNSRAAVALRLKIKEKKAAKQDLGAVVDQTVKPQSDEAKKGKEKQEIVEDEEPSLTRWKSQFVVNKIRPSHVSSVILNSDDRFFSKLNFLMLFVGTMMVCDIAGVCTPTSQAAIVNRISEDTVIRKIENCGLLIHYLKNCKSNWPQKENGEHHFKGLNTLLQQLYLDSNLLEKPPIARQRPAIKYWNSTYLNKCVAVELIANGNFGKTSSSDCISESVVEVFAVNLYSIFTKNVADTVQLDSTLKRGLSMFPVDGKLLEFNDKFHQLFREAKPSKD